MSWHHLNHRKSIAIYVSVHQRQLVDGVNHHLG